MNGSENNSMEELLQYTGQKKQLASELLKITKEKISDLESIPENNTEYMENFHRFLDKRQSIIEEINHIDNMINNLKDTVLPNPVEDREKPANEVFQLEEQIRNLFTETFTMDRELREHLLKIKSTTLEHLQTVRAGKKSVSTYTKLPRQVQGFFVDKKK